jgi:hypothetical protein
MTHHQELPMNPHAGTEHIAAVVGHPAIGLTTDTVLNMDGSLGGSVAAQSGFDEVDAAEVARTETTPAPVVAEEQAPAADKKEDEEGTGVGYLNASSTTVMDHDVFFPIEGGWKDNEVFMVGQADTQERTNKALDSLPNLDLSASESGREFIDYLLESMNGAPGKDQWRGAVDRAGSSWRQGVDSERGKISMGALNFKNVGEGTVAGEKAVLQIRALTGLGSVIQTPLWHSGFHVTFKAPSESALLNLNARLLDEKILIGRQTNGLAFANTSSYMTGWLLDFALEHIYDTSLQEKDNDKIRSLIQAPDLPILFWGLACAIWPRGFQYARPYFDPKTKEEKLLKQKLAVGKLLFTDIKSLTPWQIAHMANKGSGTMSVANVQRYRSEFVIGQPRRVELAENIAITLRVPNALDYVLSGQKWVGEITKTVDDAFELDPTDGRRADFIINQGKATGMRQYAHWVEAIHGGRATINERDSIDKVLNELSASDDVRSKYFDAIQKYIDDVTMAVIATPAAVQEEEGQLPKFPHLLPMNVEHTFFTLLDQKVTRITQRP